MDVTRAFQHPRRDAHMKKVYSLFAYVETIRASWPPDEHDMQRTWIPDDDVREMDKKGGFTRENVLWWAEHRPTRGEYEDLPLMDSHAACGDIEIPWAKEESRLAWEEEEKRGLVGPTKERVLAFDEGREP
jgi:hypothetical protein